MWAGGAERVISELVKHMNKKNIKCNIITIDAEKILYDIPAQVEIYAIGKKSENKYIDKILRYKELRNYVRGLKPSVVLTLPEDIGIFVIPALFGTGIPVVVSERNNPWIMPWKISTRICRKLFYPLASGYIFQTEQAASFFSEKIKKKGVVLPNPLDLDRISESRKNENRKEIVGAGRLDRQKNFPLLIQAFAIFHKRHSDYKLTIYGEGGLREELENFAASILQKGTYSFPGRTTELLEKMNGASMFVLSSDYEGMPNVLIEAMAMGMTVISTDCPSGGPAELIENGINGLLVPVDNIDKLSEAMNMVVDSKDLAERLGDNAKLIKKRLDSALVAEQWKEYLDAISKNE